LGRVIECARGMRLALLAGCLTPAAGFYLTWYHECDTGLSSHAPGPGHTSVTDMRNWIGDSVSRNHEISVVHLDDRCRMGISSCFSDANRDAAGHYLSAVSKGCSDPDVLLTFRFTQLPVCDALIDTLATKTTFSDFMTELGPHILGAQAGLVARIPVGACVPANRVRDSGTACASGFRAHSRVTFAGMHLWADEVSNFELSCDACGQTTAPCDSPPNRTLTGETSKDSGNSGPGVVVIAAAIAASIVTILVVGALLVHRSKPSRLGPRPAVTLGSTPSAGVAVTDCAAIAVSSSKSTNQST